MKKCPFCAEMIKDEAVKCKHCGEMLNVIDWTPRAMEFLKKHGYKTLAAVALVTMIVSITLVIRAKVLSDYSEHLLFEEESGPKAVERSVQGAPARRSARSAAKGDHYSNAITRFKSAYSKGEFESAMKHAQWALGSEDLTGPQRERMSAIVKDSREKISYLGRNEKYQYHCKLAHDAVSSAYSYMNSGDYYYRRCKTTALKTYKDYYRKAIGDYEKAIDHYGDALHYAPSSAERSSCEANIEILKGKITKVKEDASIWR